MVKLKSFFVISFFLILSFIFDSQIVLLLEGVIPGPFLFSSHMSLIALLYFEKKYSSFGLYLISVILGLIVDSYFYHTVGLAIFIYPLLVYLVKKHSGLISMGFTRFLMMVVLILIFEGGTYFLAVVYGLTKYPINLAMAYHLMPTLVLNSLILLGVSPIFKSVT